MVMHKRSEQGTISILGTTRMKNWFVPAALLGLSGLGLLFASERARGRMLGWVEQLADGADSLGEFSRFYDEQLEAIQSALDHLAEALEQQKA